MKITDEMLYQNVAEARDLWLDAAVNTIEVAHHEYPDEFKEVIKKASESRKKHKPRRGLRRVAAVFLACLIGSATWLGVDSEARASFVRWMREMVGLSPLYTYLGENQSDSISDYRFGWLPDGMFPVDLSGDDYIGYVLYMGQDGHCTLIYQQMSESTNTQLNLGEETITHEVVEINGMHGNCYVTTGDNYSCDVIWFDEAAGVAFTAGGALPKEDILRLAESVEVGAAMEMLPEYWCSWVPDGYESGSITKGTQARTRYYHPITEGMPSVRMDYKMSKDKDLREQFYIETYDEMRSLAVNGISAEFYTNTKEDGTNALVWCDEDAGLSFCLSSGLDEKTLLRIAEGVNLK